MGVNLNLSSSQIRALVLAIVILAVLAASFIFLKENNRHLYLLEKNDPLFNFPGAATAELSAFGSDLAALNKKFAEEPRAGISSPHIYPDKFWKSMAEVDQSRAAYFRDSTISNAYRLVRKEIQAASQYKEGIKQLSELMQASIEKSAPLIDDQYRFLFLPGVETDIPAFNKALQAIQKNGEQLKKETLGRQWCLFWGECPDPKEISQAKSAISSEEQKKFNSLPASFLEGTRKTIGASELDKRYFSVRSPCFPDNHPPSFLLWERGYPGNKKTFFPKLASDSFYRSIDSKNFLPQNAIAVKEKLKYVWQPETQIYLCPDLEYYPKLASMLAILREVEKKPLDAMSDEIKEAEYRLSHEIYLDESMVDAYIETLREFQANEDVASRISLWETKSGLLGRLFENIQVDALRYLGMIKNSRYSLVPVTAVLTQSHASLTFSPWNPSVWRTGSSPVFVNSGKPIPGSHPLTGYQKIRMGLSENDLHKIESATVRGSELLFP